MEYMRIYGMSAIIKEKVAPKIIILNDYREFLRKDYHHNMSNCWFFSWIVSREGVFGGTFRNFQKTKVLQNEEETFSNYSPSLPQNYSGNYDIWVITENWSDDTKKSFWKIKETTFKETTFYLFSLEVDQI